MKKILIFTFFILSNYLVNAQNLTFRDNGSVTSFMEGKIYYNSDTKLEIEYGYISSYNTYGIKVKNNYGDKFYFINVEITAFWNFADLYGMNAESGKNFGFRVYRDKLIIGRGEVGEQIYYMK